MNTFFKALVGVSLGMTAAIANAASMDPLDPIANNGFDSSSVLLSMDLGSAVYLGPDPDPASEFFTGSTSSGADPFFTVSSFDLDDESFAEIDLFIGIDPAITILGAEDVHVADELVQFLFIDDVTGIGYLAEFEIDETVALDVFTNEAAFIGADASVTLTQYTVTAVPLPASLPLVLLGVGGFVAMGRRKKATA